MRRVIDEHRPHQKEAHKAAMEALNKTGATYIEAATGTGKTRIALGLAQEWEGKRVLIVEPGNTLYVQTVEKAQEFLGDDNVDGIKSGISQDTKEHFVVVAGKETLCSPKNPDYFANYPKDAFDLIIFDEAHHAVTDQYKQIINHFTNAKIIGLTATPDRQDRQDISTIFGPACFKYPLYDAIKDGILVPIYVKHVKPQIDFKTIYDACKSSNDVVLERLGAMYTAEKTREILSEQIKESIKELEEQSGQKMKTVIYMPTIESSRLLAEELEKRGMKTAWVCGDDGLLNAHTNQTAQEIQKDFEDGKYDIIINAQKLTEGWDCPEVNCVINLAMTKSHSNYLQKIGRGTRLDTNNLDKKCYIIDMTPPSLIHEIENPATLLNTFYINNKSVETIFDTYKNKTEPVNLKKIFDPILEQYLNKFDKEEIEFYEMKEQLIPIIKEFEYLYDAETYYKENNIKTTLLDYVSNMTYNTNTVQTTTLFNIKTDKDDFLEKNKALMNFLFRVNGDGGTLDQAKTLAIIRSSKSRRKTAKEIPKMEDIINYKTNNRDYDVKFDKLHQYRNCSDVNKWTKKNMEAAEKKCEEIGLENFEKQYNLKAKMIKSISKTLGIDISPQDLYYPKTDVDSISKNELTALYVFLKSHQAHCILQQMSFETFYNSCVLSDKERRFVTDAIEGRLNFLSTSNQIEFLTKKGFKNVREWMYDDCQIVIDAIKANAFPENMDYSKYTPPSKKSRAKYEFDFEKRTDFKNRETPPTFDQVNKLIGYGMRPQTICYLSKKEANQVIADIRDYKTKRRIAPWIGKCNGNIKEYIPQKTKNNGKENENRRPAPANDRNRSLDETISAARQKVQGNSNLIYNNANNQNRDNNNHDEI